MVLLVSSRSTVHVYYHPRRRRRPPPSYTATREHIKVLSCVNQICELIVSLAQNMYSITTTHVSV